jgi:hypothetical protein
VPTFPLRDSISINGLEYTLFQFSAAGRAQAQGRPPGGDEQTSIPQLSGEPVDPSDEPLPMDTFHLGAFYSWRLLAGTYAWAQNGDARIPRLVLPGPFVNALTLPGAADYPRCAKDYGGDLYIGCGRYIYRIAGGTGAAVQDQDLGAGVVAWSLETFGGALYCGTSVGSTSASAPEKLWSKAAPGAGGWTNTAGLLRKSLAVAWYQTSGSLGYVGSFQMIGQDTASSVRNVATAPMTPANWGASVPIGDTTYGINRLIADQTHVYIAKTNGLHDLDGISGRTPNLMPFFASGVDDENGIAGHSSGGFVYVNHLSGLFRLDVSGAASSRLVTVTPGHGLPNETPIRGKIIASTSWGAWQIVAVYNGVDTYLCWGRDIMQGDAGVSPFGYGYGYGPSPAAMGPSPMLWHGGIIYLPGQRCYLLYISALNSPPRLWFGNGTQMGWCVLPRTENPLQDSEYRWAQTWSLFIPGQDWGHPATPKELLQVDLEGDNLGGGAEITVNMNAEQGPYAVWGVANTSPQSMLPFVQPFIGRRLGFRLDGLNTSTTPAILRVLMPRAQVRTAVRMLRTYQILLGFGNQDRFGGQGIGRAIEEYRTLSRLQTAGPCTVRDEFGETYTCLVIPPVSRQVLYLRAESGRDTNEPVLLATILIKAISSADVATMVPWHWDDGHRWDTGTIWTT